MTPCHHSKWDQIFNVSYKVLWIIFSVFFTLPFLEVDFKFILIVHFYISHHLFYTYFIRFVKQNINIVLVLKRCFLLLKFLDTEKELSKSKIVTVCHGDVWSNNMLFTEDDESVTLIDFQMLGRVHPALDLWYFLAVNSDKVSCRARSNMPWRKKGAYF